MFKKMISLFQRLPLSAGLICAVLLFSYTSNPSATDLHWLWDDRCEVCHGHAGDFAREYLTVSNGELQGRHHVHDLRLFLGNHNLGESNIDDVYKMLLAQASSEARFRHECARCHASAAEFVRSSIRLKDGRLISRNTGADIRHFIETHRNLSISDQRFYLDLLMRVAQEVD